MGVRRLLRDPLVHFLALGGLGFVVFSAMAPADERGLVVGADEVAALEAGHRSRAGRNPSPEELQTLLDAHIRTKLLEHHGRALGLGDNDPVIAHHIASKMERVLEGEAVPATESEIRSYFEQNIERYRLPARVSFEHVFVGPPGTQTSAIDEVRTAVREVEDPLTLGVAFPHGNRFPPLSRQQVGGRFGPTFAEALWGMDPSPAFSVAHSAHGVHLVRVLERSSERDATFEEARELARRDLMATRRRDAVDAAVARLREQTPVEVVK